MRMTFVPLAVAGLILASAAPASGQELRVAEKDPAIALGFAWLCPGCGHLYTGETTKGTVIAAVSVGSVATGLAIQFARGMGNTRQLQSCDVRAFQTDCGKLDTDLTPILVGGAIGLAGYLYGLIDAGPSARRMNARNGAGFGVIDVRPMLARDGSVRTDLGIRIPTR